MSILASNPHPFRRAHVVLGACVGLMVATLIASSPAANAAIPAPESERNRIKRMVVEEAAASTVPPALALAVAKVGSDFQTDARSASGARGVMQIRPEIAERVFDVDPAALFEPDLNIRIGLDWLERLFRRHGGWDQALAHHHAGHLVGGAAVADPAPLARGYVEAVTRWRDRYAAQQTVWAQLSQREQALLADDVGRFRPEPGLDLDFDDLERETMARARERHERQPIVRWYPPRRAQVAMDIEERRLLAGPYLDDFTPLPAYLRPLEN